MLPYVNYIILKSFSCTAFSRVRSYMRSTQYDNLFGLEPYKIPSSASAIWVNTGLKQTLDFVTVGRDESEKSGKIHRRSSKVMHKKQNDQKANLILICN